MAVATGSMQQGGNHPSNNVSITADDAASSTIKNAPGGLFGYFISRKKEAGHNAATLRPMNNAPNSSSSAGSNNDNDNSNNRDKNKLRRRITKVMKYHEKAGGSFDFGSMGALLLDDSDSDDDDNGPRRATFDTVEDSTVADNKSW
eukprot:CAMPEP_0201931808 /NCGR_PEP_ID=MMETSP0903-20130614/28173_1 /ASSEMBLY_ACC=CAM_ASM_000552 /TAXON_ID=420261 /ORGANISM="Thalassiosira antarctica, Strain CCMP982" /LENGTH=145 /DNA_ID=CAMNT_0048471237 /DNA_START=128 /DNA_END=562 /DNA_ORIENTATION=-